MKVFLNILVLILLNSVVVSLTSCKKENSNDCFSQPGKIVIEDREASYFDDLEMYDNVNVVLVEGDAFSIKVEGGENIIDAVKTEIADSTLKIRNTLICNWVRSYDTELTVIITSPALSSIRYESSGDLNTQGKLNIESLALNVWGGAGTIKLDVSSKWLGLGLHYGTTDIHVKGNSSNTTIYANSFGPFYCSELISNNVYIKNYGTNDCYIYAHDILEAEISSVGNIFYRGNPRSVSCYDHGDGNLIPEDE